ncbi:MAG: ABC transporter permease [candidate division Zixibacteria bacterium]|nr:ABC transporter permease [candidate division Zixibacteria bacterium]
MIYLSLLSESVKALWSNKLRSFLTLLGMVMGVTAVITIVSTVEGMQQNLEDVFSTMGPNTVIVTRFGVGLSMNEYLERRRRKKLTRGLIPLIEQGCPDCKYVGAEGYAQDHIKYESKKVRRVQINGETPNILDMQDLDVALGRYLSWEDDRRHKQVAFLGNDIYERLFDNEDPLGKKIRVGKNEFTVIGVAEKIGTVFGQTLDDFISIPLSTQQKLYPQPGNPVNLIFSAVSMERREMAIDQVRVVLRSARQVPFSSKDDFSFVTAETVMSFINDFTRAFRVILIALPLLSMVIGGIVIMNIMMISVTERVREIGIRKAIGAKSKHILVQFLYESLVLSIIGGAVGAGLGIWAGGEVLSSLMDIQHTPMMMAVLLGLSISTGVGLFFGIFPALKASKLDPVKALSHE